MQSTQHYIDNTRRRYYRYVCKIENQFKTRFQQFNEITYTIKQYLLFHQQLFHLFDVYDCQDE